MSKLSECQNNLQKARAERDELKAEVANLKVKLRGAY